MLAGVVLALALALEVPAAPTARVNDYAELLQPTEHQRLESLIAERERATSAQVVIAIFSSLAGGSLEDFSIKLAEKWRIGQKGLDNGVIVLVFVEDRKIRLEVGYGLEPVVPDIVAGQIVREVVAPRFKERRYAAGLEAAVQEIYSRVEAGPNAPARRAPPARPATGQSWPVVGFVFVVVVVIAVLGMEASRSRRFVSGRGYTGGSGGWMGPVIFPGWGGGGRGGGGGGGGDVFSGGGGTFGGGGASGEW